MAVSQRRRKLSIQIHESEGSAEYVRITPEKFELALNQHADLREHLSVTFSSSPADLVASLAKAEVLVLGHARFQGLFAHAPHLKWIQSIFAGVERLVSHVPANVTLTNASGVHATKAGEFVTGAVVMLNTRLPQLNEAQKSRRWHQIFRPGLQEQVAVVLGTGALGSEIGSRLKSFGMRVIGVSRSGSPNANFDNVYATAEIGNALTDGNYLISTLPNTAATRGLIGAPEIDRLKPGAGIVSIGRAQVFDHAAVVNALESERLSGAFFDVFESEPLPEDSPLWTTKNLVVIPHCGIDDADHYVPALLNIFFENVSRYLNGEPLRNTVDLAQGY
jgi:phosphoglycerate dehydrogenase-like enzyme